MTSQIPERTTVYTRTPGTTKWQLLHDLPVAETRTIRAVDDDTTEHHLHIIRCIASVPGLGEYLIWQPDLVTPTIQEHAICDPGDTLEFFIRFTRQLALEYFKAKGE
jgi:hypothetical protein